MPVNTADQQITMPIGADAADNPVAFVNAVADVEQRLVRIYTNEADRTARMLSVAENELSGLATENRVDVYDGTNHVSLFSRSSFVYARKTLDQNLTISSTVMQDVTTLLAPMPTAGTFGFDAFVIYSSAVAADIKFSFTFPAGATVAWNGLGVATTGTATGDGTFNIITVSDTPIAMGGNGVGVPMAARFEGSYIAGGTAGNLQMRAAQNTSDATQSVVLAQSRLRVWRMA